MRLALLLLGSVAFGQMSDVEGWSKSKWGMTEDQVLKVFGGEVRRVNPMDLVPHRLIVDRVEIGRWIFSAYFTFDDSKLSTVRLEADRYQPADATKLAIFTDLLRMLIDK